MQLALASLLLYGAEAFGSLLTADIFVFCSLQASPDAWVGEA